MNKGYAREDSDERGNKRNTSATKTPSFQSLTSERFPIEQSTSRLKNL